MIESATDPELEHQATWYRSGPQMASFHESNAWCRVLVGGRGTGKSSGVTIEAIRHTWHFAGSKTLLVRKTEASQADSTIDTHNIVYNNMGDLYRETATSLFKRWNDGRTVRLPSRLAVDKYNEFQNEKPRSKSELIQWLDTEGTRLCGFVEMRGLPNSGTSESKLRGFECSLMCFIEADQIAEKDFQLGLACLRWKGSDPATCDDNGFIINTGVIVDTNPPGTQHWIAKIEEREKAKPPGESDMEFWHISTYENEHNLPPGYIERQILLPYSGNPAMIQRMLYGQYADAFDGNAVYHAFDSVKHAGEDLPWPEGAYLIRGYDFGVNNNCLYSAYWMDGEDEYLHILMDQFMDGSDTDRQAAATVKNTAECFPFWNDRTLCAGVLDYGDPAGANSNYSTGDTASCQKIFATYGIHPGFNLHTKGIMEGVGIINRFLNKRDKKGNVCFKIDKKNAYGTWKAFAGEYRFPSVGESGYGSDKPLKGTLCNMSDSYADCARYTMLNVLKLAKMPHEKIADPKHYKKRNVNPDRQI